MADNSTIGWTEATWNPATGCTKVSPGCEHCYAETFAERWRGTPGHPYEHGFDLTLRPERLDQPLRWKRARMIFVNSMSDLFHAGIPDEFIAEVFAVMALAPRHVFQVLTKRHARMRALLNSGLFLNLVWVALGSRGVEPQRYVDPVSLRNWPLPHVWLGVSVESQQWADIRIPALLDTPAAVRWLSCEPLLEPVQLPAFVVAGAADCPCEHGAEWCLPNIDWIVVGGESGPGARPMLPDWARSLRDQCATGGIPFFFKQTGTVLARELGIPGKGEDWDLLPAEFQVREYPYQPAVA